MDLLIEHGNKLILLFLSPIGGLLFDYLVKRSTRKWLLGITTIFLVPIFTDYEYIFPYLFQILGLIWFSLIYSFYSQLLTKNVTKIVTSGIITFLLFMILSFASFMDSFGGYKEVDKVWIDNGYRIEKKTSYGFSGRPATSYYLEKYAWIPLFKREVEISSEIDSTDNCLIHFKDERVTLNQCKELINTHNNK